MIIKLIPFMLMLGVVSLLTERPHQPVSGKLNAPLNCIDSLPVSNTAIQLMIGKYVRQVESYELPIIAMHQRNDTTFYYVSALIATNSIRRNPPTGISIQFGREALIYMRTKSKKLIDPKCQAYLINKYVKVLHVDKLNTKYNLPVGTRRGTLYDPLLVKIIETKGRVTLSSVDRFPDFDYGGL